jgi:hypothetical protein
MLFPASIGDCLSCASFLRDVFQIRSWVRSSYSGLEVFVSTRVVAWFRFLLCFEGSCSPPLEVNAAPRQKANHYYTRVSNLRNKNEPLTFRILISWRARWYKSIYNLKIDTIEMLVHHSIDAFFPALKRYMTCHAIYLHPNIYIAHIYMVEAFRVQATRTI